MASLTTSALLELWLVDLRANDLAPGTVRRYKQGVTVFGLCVAQVTCNEQSASFPWVIILTFLSGHPQTAALTHVRDG